MHASPSLLFLAAVAVPAASSHAQVRTVTFERDGEIAHVLPHTGPGLAVPAVAASSGAASALGGSWQPMSVPPGLFLRAISMASAQVGFAVGELGVVVRTSDGGATWQIVQNLGFPYYWYGVQALSTNDVVVTGFQNQTGDGILEWSHDGGATFGPIVSLPAPGAGLRWLDRVEFADTQHGLIAASWVGGVQRTSSGGALASDWSYAPVSSGWFSGTFTHLADGRAWLAGIDQAFSASHGASWTVANGTNATFDGPISIHQLGVGFVGGGTISPSVSGWIFRTRNAGHSWTGMPVHQTAYPIRALLAHTTTRAWAAGGNYFSSVGGLLGSSDGGFTWTLEQSTGNEMNDLDAVRVDATHVHVFAAGYVSQIWRKTIVEPEATALVATSYGFCDAPSAPCGNVYDSGGCASGIGVGGMLTASGSSSVAADDLVLGGFQLPTMKSALCFVGPAAQEIVLGNGLNCVAGGASGVRRFPIQNTGVAGTLTQGPGIVAYTQAAFPAASWITPGSTWRFQGYYRDPIGPCGSTMNLTNALSVSFNP